MSDSKVINPSGYDNLLHNEFRCLKLAVSENKRTFVKVVVTNVTDIIEFRKLVREIFESVKPSDIMGFVIQPSYGIDEPTIENLLNFYDSVYPVYEEVRIVPQLHKLIGVR
jgi:7-carboxy-7-deazaguanine synthase